MNKHVKLLFCLIIIFFTGCYTSYQYNSQRKIPPIEKAKKINLKIYKIDKETAKKNFKYALSDYFTSSIWRYMDGTGGWIYDIGTLMKKREFIGAKLLKRKNGISLMFLFSDKGLFYPDNTFTILDLSKNSVIKAYVWNTKGCVRCGEIGNGRTNVYFLVITKAKLVAAGDLTRVVPRNVGGYWYFEYYEKNSIGGSNEVVNFNDGFNNIATAVLQETKQINSYKNNIIAKDLVLPFSSKSELESFASEIVSVFPFLKLDNDKDKK